jgi:uncharacterized membrane protein YidH (DUF202 family)
VSTGEGPYDPGLQPERTLLAWRRTCLALGLSAALAVRFAAETLGPAAAVLGALGIGTALAAYLVSARRYRTAQAELRAAGRVPVDGAALGLLTMTLLATGAAAAVYVAGAWWR